MRRLLLAVACLALLGCEDDVTVLSADGTKDLGYCSTHWAKCVSDVCPNGYIIVKQPSGDTIGIIRCKE